MFAVILCTSSHQEAGRIAGTLVEEKLVACVNVGEVNSYFRWEGEVQEEGEALLIMKTRSGKVKEIIRRIRELHSYEVPEIIALPIIDGHEGYLDWVKESVE
jgi:periplasmic divalent cation tolerance protein